MSRTIKQLGLLVVLLSVCACAWTHPREMEQREMGQNHRIFALPEDFYPESIAVTHEGNFYIGSWRQGSIARLKAGEEKANIFVPAGSNGLSNTQGVLVDEKRGLLWACSGDLGYASVPKTPSALKSFDLSTGATRRSYALPGGGYCNDLAMAGDGRLYVTDSKRPRVLVLENPQGRLKPWATDPDFCFGPNGFCLNGIAIDPGRAVYVSAVNATDKLFRVPFKANDEPGRIETVRFPRPLKNADAIRFLNHRQLLIFESNAFAKNDPLDGSISLAKFHDDGTASLDPFVNGLAAPSSGIVYQGRVYFIQSKYTILLRYPADDTRKVPSGVPFAVESVALPGVATDQP
jgi:sugar lactone lactonase YvrE